MSEFYERVQVIAEDFKKKLDLALENSVDIEENSTDELVERFHLYTQELIDYDD